MQAYSTIEDMTAWANGVMKSREPDFIIGDNYLRRWWIIPRNEGCNVYLHEILKSDEDRAGHDHPWRNTSYVLDGEYEEVTYYRNEPWTEMARHNRKAGDIVQREAEDCHRLILPEGGRAVSLFITGPKIRDWGFWCANGPKFVRWQDFTSDDPGQIGKGCD